MVKTKPEKVTINLSVDLDKNYKNFEHTTDDEELLSQIIINAIASGLASYTGLAKKLEVSYLSIMYGPMVDNSKIEIDISKIRKEKEGEKKEEKFDKLNMDFKPRGKRDPNPRTISKRNKDED